ncbi:MAG TPA: ABC transporter substrate-binding protein [Alphaproteobacteria bacterium]|nr:ABC transporter substrate-binding protein [Alphaproteobacteria bacterium]
MDGHIGGSQPWRIGRRPLLALLPALLAARAAPAAMPGAPGNRVAFVLPHPPSPFWDDLTDAMRAAAAALGLALDIRFGQEDHLAYLQALSELAQSPQRPDFLIVKPFKRVTARVLEIAAAAGIRVLTINATPGAEEGAELGAPRGRFPNWIGALAPDNEATGHMLARSLFAAARAAGLGGPDGRLRAVGVGGLVADLPSIDRIAGLRRAAREDGRVELLQIVNTDWTEADGRQRIAGLLRRHGRVDVIWTAADILGFAANAAAGAAGLRAGQDYVTGGVDWLAPALAAVKDGRFAATAGGLVLEGAWACVLLHDYRRGRDFADLGLALRSPTAVLTAAEVDAYLGKFPIAWPRIDWRRFARAEGGGYDFSIEAVLAGL